MTRPLRGCVGDLGFWWGVGLGGVGDPDGGVVAVVVVFCEMCCGATGLFDPGLYR